MSGRRERDYINIGLEAELTRLEATDAKVKQAREKLDEVTSPYAFWRRDMVRNLYADSGDPS